jgi:hypothetical protein
MTVWILMREDQNDHGYVDTDVVGVFWAQNSAEEQLRAEQEFARGEGLLVDGDSNTPDGDWQVSWSICEQTVV